MIQKLIHSFVREENRPKVVYRNQPERPIGFVRRSDPSFYFLSKR